MSTISPEKQVMLLFPSLAAISQFKNECTCNDFYVDRDALTLVGFFTTEQVEVAVSKYNAQSVVMKM